MRKRITISFSNYIFRYSSAESNDCVQCTVYYVQCERIAHTKCRFVQFSTIICFMNWELKMFEIAAVYCKSIVRFHWRKCIYFLHKIVPSIAFRISFNRLFLSISFFHIYFFLSNVLLLPTAYCTGICSTMGFPCFKMQGGTFVRHLPDRKPFSIIIMIEFRDCARYRYGKFKQVGRFGSTRDIRMFEPVIINSLLCHE